MGSKTEDDVGASYRGKDGRDVKRACVSGVYTFSIWEAGDNGLVSWAFVGHGGNSCEKVTCPTRVKDGPCSYGGHVNIDSFGSAQLNGGGGDEEDFG